MNPEDLDDVKLIIRGDRPCLVFIKDRETAVMLVGDLMTAWFTDHRGALTVRIEDVDHEFTEPVWRALYHEVDPWFSAYLDYCACLPEVIPLFPQALFPKSES